MEYDDRYHPSNNNDVEKRSYNLIDDIKNIDIGYNEIYRKVTQNNGRLKNKKIVVYNSGDFGSQIRDAVTGKYTRDIVGSLNEDLYFSLVLATGEVPNKRVVLYFDSPEQCERHLNQTISERIKETWNNKRLRRLNTVSNL
jgi:hypothetical protein